MTSDLDDLERRLEKASEQSGLTPEQARNAENMSTGMKAGTELVGSILAGGLIGYLLDGWLDTKPVWLIIMLILGVITGFVNVWRVTQNIGTNVGFSELHKQKKPFKKPADIEESE